MATTITANGINFPDGSAGSPSIGGTDTNTGLFTGSDIVGFATGGSERLRIDASGNINIANDSGKLRLGTGADLELFHDSSHSRIHNNTGLLLIECDGTGVEINSGASTENMAKFLKDGAVELYHNNVKRFETDTDGVRVVAPEGAQAMLRLIGDEGDDNNDYFRLNAGGGTLKLQDASNGSSWEDNIVINAAGSVELYYDNAKRLFTRSNGITVQGNGSSSGIDFQTDTTHRGTVWANSSNQIGFLDTGGDWAIKHTNDDSTKFYVQTNQKATIDADGLKFGTDSAAANALDDYEEGTFTPLMGGSNYGSYNITGTGKYTKIGRVVYFQLQFSNKDLDNNASGDMRIRNWPFTWSTTSARPVVPVVMMHNVIMPDDGNTNPSTYALYGGDDGISMYGIHSHDGTDWDGWSINSFESSGLYLDINGSYMT